MATMDVFNGDAFNTVELTTALNKVPYKPMWLGQLGIFQPKPVRTETVAIEKRENVLSLVQTTARGAPLPQLRKSERDIRDFRTVRVAKGDRLTASEVQNIRAFGSESELEQVQTEVMDRMVRLRDDIEVTHENMRLGAIFGVVTDANGEVIRDWFAEWGISQPAEIAFELNKADTDVRGKCNRVVREMSKASKGAFTQQTRVYALAGDDFFDKLISHPTVRETYLNWAAAADLREGAAYSEFTYGGITFVNYRGMDSGELSISPSKVKFFPVGARDVFQHAMSPGESFDFVNTPGQPVYSMLVPDRDRNQFVDIEDYSYPLYICSRPEVLLRGKV